MAGTNTALRRTATEVKNHRRIVRITWAVLGIFLAVTILTTVVSVLYSRYGSFTVTINKIDNINYGLALSETRTFDTPMARLNYRANEGVTNISKYTLPENLDSDEGGQHNGNNYVAYTFFLKNTGKAAMTCQYELFIVNMTNGMQDALRVRVYMNNDGEYGNVVDYAEVAADGLPEPETKAFLTETMVTAGEIADYQPGAIKRFTIVMWLEGDDPECTDDILGGMVKLDMNFSVLSSEGEEI